VDLRQPLDHTEIGPAGTAGGTSKALVPGGASEGGTVAQMDSQVMVHADNQDKDVMLELDPKAMNVVEINYEDKPGIGIRNLNKLRQVGIHFSNWYLGYLPRVKWQAGLHWSNLLLMLMLI